MLDANLTAQLKSYLERLTRPVVITASVDDSTKSAQMVKMLQQVADLSDKLSFAADGADKRRPSFSLTSPGQEISLRFAGLPMGHEFTSLVLALLQVGGHPRKLNRKFWIRSKVWTAASLLKPTSHSPARTVLMLSKPLT